MANALGVPRIERLLYGKCADGLAAEADGPHTPLVSIVLPTLDGQRRGLLQQLLEDLNAQTLLAFEVLLVIGDRRQGRAINRGAAAARADVIVTMDDDTGIGTPRLLEQLLHVLRTRADVGMVGASTVVPPGASWFQRSASRQVPRRLFPIVKHLTDSDMVQHPCLAMRREQFFAVGGEDEELIRGLDPSLRFRVREAGLRVVIAPHTFISHPLPESWRALLRMYFRNGRGSAFAQRNYPERVYQLTDGFRNNQFRSRVPLAWRVARFPWRMLRSVFTLQWIRLSVECAYIAGYLREAVRPQQAESPTPVAYSGS